MFALKSLMAARRSNPGWWIFGIAVIVVPFLFYLIIGGRVDGEEFSPDDFSRRYFSYNIMPSKFSPSDPRIQTGNYTVLPQFSRGLSTAKQAVFHRRKSFAILMMRADA